MNLIKEQQSTMLSAQRWSSLESHWCHIITFHPSANFEGSTRDTHTHTVYFSLTNYSNLYLKTKFKSKPVVTQTYFSSLSAQCRDKQPSVECNGVCLKRKEKARQIMNVRIHWGQTAQQAHCLLSIKKVCLFLGSFGAVQKISGKEGDCNQRICEVHGLNSALCVFLILHFFG